MSERPCQSVTQPSASLHGSTRYCGWRARLLLLLPCTLTPLMVLEGQRALSQVALADNNLLKEAVEELQRENKLLSSQLAEKTAASSDGYGAVSPPPPPPPQLCDTVSACRSELLAQGPRGLCSSALLVVGRYIDQQV